MSIRFVDLKAQYRALQDKIQSRINTVLEHGQYIMGPEVAELEGRLQAFTGAKYCITVSSGTDALLISLMALGIQPGDEVITTPFTFASTVEVIALLGAIPVFADVEEDTGNIDASLIEARITPRTRAIVPVSLYGQPADMDEINSVAIRYGNIPVVEDAAQSFGATYKGVKSCNLSAIGCTSFFPSKPLGCYGDGGAIFTNDQILAKACSEIRVHGQSERYVHTRIGVGGRMDTLQCAVVLAKLDRFEWELEQREKIGERYNSMFDQLGFARIQQRSNRTSVFAQYTIKAENREILRSQLSDAGVPTVVHYPTTLNNQPAYRDICSSDAMPVAEGLSREVISLPMHPSLSDVDQHVILAMIKENMLSGKDVGPQ